MHRFSMRPAKYFYDKPLPKYLDPKTVLIYRLHPVLHNPRTLFNRKVQLRLVLHFASSQLFCWQLTAYCRRRHIPTTTSPSFVNILCRLLLVNIFLHLPSCTLTCELFPRGLPLLPSTTIRSFFISSQSCAAISLLLFIFSWLEHVTHNFVGKLPRFTVVDPDLVGSEWLGKESPELRIGVRKKSFRIANTNQALIFHCSQQVRIF